MIVVNNYYELISIVAVAVLFQDHTPIFLFFGSTFFYHIYFLIFSYAIYCGFEYSMHCFLSYALISLSFMMLYYSLNNCVIVFKYVL